MPTVPPSAWLTLTTTSTSLDSLEAAKEQSEAVGRRRDIPVRKSFVRSMDGATPAPLAQIYAGGRGGLVAVKLYLALIWRCAAAEYETDKPARAWATLLDLEDPRGKGARRVSNAMKTLQEAKLITITAQDGRPNVTRLLVEDGSGGVYSPPSTAYQFSKTPEQRRENMYFKIAGQLWLDGVFQELSGPATVMLLILLAEQADDPKKKIWFSTSEFPKRYRISHKTRANGTAELVARGLLKTEREPLSPKASVFETVRKRTIYRLLDDPDTRSGIAKQSQYFTLADPIMISAEPGKPQRQRKTNEANRKRKTAS
ncbi:hypothetical protein [Amycolatopsis japonica]